MLKARLVLFHLRHLFRSLRVCPFLPVSALNLLSPSLGKRQVGKGDKVCFSARAMAVASGLCGSSSVRFQERAFLADLAHHAVSGEPCGIWVRRRLQVRWPDTTRHLPSARGFPVNPFPPVSGAALRSSVIVWWHARVFTLE